MIILIPRKTHYTLEEIMVDFPRSFKSLAHLEGFCLGRFFSEHKLLTEEAFAKQFNGNGYDACKYYIIFPNILQDTKEDS